MIELCTVRQMAFFIIALAGSSLLVLFIEGHYQTTPHFEVQNETTADHGFVCSVKTVEDACRQCKPWDKEHIEACNITGYIKIETCRSKDTTESPRSMKSSCMPRHTNTAQQKTFWIHGGVLLGVGIISTWLAYSRRQMLDRELMEKVNKQISAGV